MYRKRIISVSCYQLFNRTSALQIVFICISAPVSELNASSRRIVFPLPHAVKIFSRASTYRSFIEVYLPRQIRI